MINQLRFFFEKYGFEVCSRIGDRLGMRAKNIRLSFMYFTFFTLGFWFGFYLILAFLFKIKDLIQSKRSSVFDL